MNEDPGYGPRLWDAGEGVCCASFQLGACSHTEDQDADWDDDEDWEAPTTEADR